MTRSPIEIVCCARVMFADGQIVAGYRRYANEMCGKVMVAKECGS